MMWLPLLGLAILPTVCGTASTDFLQDTDSAQSGYLPNHNLTPAIASAFTLNWKMAFNANEAFYAKPLVWTPPGGLNEQVIVVSSQNNVRILDGLTGIVVNQRTLDPPFQSVDTGGCGDIPNTVGITGTPIIDPVTNIMYLFSKGYKGGAVGPAGTLQGQYKFYAIQLPSLTDAFPAVVLDGHYADNDHARYFVGGTLLNRPGLAMLGNTVIGAFGGHCDNFNYTGMLVAVSKTSGLGVTSVIAMEAAPGAPSPQPTDYTVQMGGKAGIWQSGFGIAADTANSRVFFVTGNGAGGAGDNGKGKPASGKVPISTLQQATVNMGLSAAGVFKQQDYFEPYEYASLDGGDIDFGSSGAALLSPYFSGGGVSQVVVAGGKSGKIYFMDANQLGGFAYGASGSDAVLQTITSSNKLLSGVASYPAEGGYIYYCPTAQGGAGAYLTAYKFTPGPNGVPRFTLAGQSAIQFAGVGAPTVTSLNGQAGTAIVWMADVNNGLVAYNAIPVGGVLQRISTVSTGRLQKYQRPAFGNARVYTTETNHIYGIGASTTPLITCTPNPIAFGSLVAGLTKTVNVKCTAGKSALTLKGCSTNLDIFQCSGVPATLAAGSSFTIPIILNLTSAAIELTRTSNNVDVVPGALAGSLSILPTSGVALTTVSLTGTQTAAGGYIDLSAVQIDFGGVVMGHSSTATLNVKNDGAGLLTFTGFAHQSAYSAPYQNVSTSGNPVVLGSGFTAIGFPVNGGTVTPAGSISISLTFTPTVTGSSATILTFWSDGGWQEVMLVGTASACTVSCSSSSSTHVSSSSSSKLSSSSTSSSSSSISSSSSSKLSTSSTLSPSSSISSSSSPTTSSSSRTSTTSSVASTSTLSSITASRTSASASASPTLAIRPMIGEYSFQGCYTESTTGRALSEVSFYNYTAMTLEMCLGVCSGFKYFGVEYGGECYCGNSLNAGSVVAPVQTDCNFICPGNQYEYCGAAVMLEMYMTNATLPVPPEPTTVPSVGNCAWYGCYTEANNTRALNSLAVYNYTLMSVEICAQACAGYTMFGVEFSGECYCGNALQAGSILAPVTDCNQACDGTPTEYCGAGNRLDVYSCGSSSSTSSSRATSSTTTSSTSSSTTFTTSSSKGPSSNTVTTTSIHSTFVTSTSSSSTPTATGYEYMGCFADTTTGHALPLLLSSTSMTPELCENLVSSLAANPTPTVYPYYYVEYHKECYAGSSFAFSNQAVTSLYGAGACTDVCSGSVGATSTGTAFCGGLKQFNLYATKSSLPFSAAVTQSK